MVVNAEPGSDCAMPHFLMLVSLRYTPIIIKHGLSPRQLWAELGGSIIANGDQDKCAHC
jgi:hypothetical protein